MTQRFRYLLPVVLNGGIGTYALARQLHEVTSTPVTAAASDSIVAIFESTYVAVVHQKAGAPPEWTIVLLRRLAQGRRPRSVALMANTDVAAAMVSAHRIELEPTYVLSFPDIDVLDAISDKASFSHLHAEVGVLTPRGVVTGPANPDCMTPTSAGEFGMEFPLMAKVAIGADYDHISFPGKRKIWLIGSAAELAGMQRSLREAGYRSTFLVQECIPGDDTAMRSVTTYMNSTGEPCLVGSARVLLQDHAPTITDNPVATMTEVLPDLWEVTGRLLRRAGYHGFANLDIKVNPRNGREFLFEINSRIGRNSFYLVAADANPMVVMLEDLVLDQHGEPIEVTQQVLYSLIPDGVIVRYMSDEALRRKAKGLGWDVGSLCDPTEHSLHRRATIELQRLDHYRKFVRNYP